MANSSRSSSNRASTSENLSGARTAADCGKEPWRRGAHGHVHSAGRRKSMIKNSGKLLLALASVAVVAGCASTKLDKPAEVEKKDVTTTQQKQTTPDTGKSTVATTDESSKVVAPITLDRVIYFAFDSYAVKDEFR